MQAEQLSTARSHFEADGYYLQKQPIIPPDIIQRGIDGMDAVRAGSYDTGRPPQPSPWNPGDDLNKLCKIEMPQIASKDVMALVSHPAIGELAAEITGAKWVQLWWVQLLYKPSASTTGAPTIGWHQDYFYWKSAWDEDSQLFTAWVALSDVADNAGPMKFVRGSHQWGLLDQGDFFGEFEKQQLLAPDAQPLDEAAAVLPPGGVSFHDKLVFHGSGPNVSGVPRRSFAIHLRTDQSRPRDQERSGLTEFIDNLDFCPIIYGSL